MAITTPQSYWKLDESSGTAVDIVGGFNGTNTSVTYSAGKINNGANFNGTTSKLDLSTTAFAPTTAVSFSCWINCSSYATRQAIFAKTDGIANLTTAFIFEVGNTSGKLTMTLSQGATTMTTTSASSLTSSAWSFVTFTYDGANMKIYINGTLDVTTAGTGSINNITQATALGYFGSYSLLTLNGALDECGFWNNYALTASEITQLYNGGNGLQYPFIKNNSAMMAFF